MRKVGLITSYKELNCGAELQAFALVQAIKECGYDCEIVWLKSSRSKYNDLRWMKLFGTVSKMMLHPSIIRSTLKAYGKAYSSEIDDVSKALFDKFKETYLPVRLYSYHELKHEEREYYKFVCGSDQIWNSYALYVDPMYYLRFTPKRKRIAYAPSLGKSSIPSYNKNKIKKYVNEMRSISVREETGAKLLRELIGRKIHVCLDPSFLLTCNEWDRLLSLDLLEKPNKKFCFAYFLGTPSREAIDKLRELSREYEIFYSPYKYEELSQYHYCSCGPREFLSLIESAQVILTDSFHGTAFSINFNKDFFTFPRDYSGNQNQSSRIVDLLAMFGLNDRYVTAGNQNLSPIDYNNTNLILDRLRSKSKFFLQKCLDNE